MALLTVEEAADRLRIGRTFARELTYTGELPVVRIRRRVLVSEEDLAAFVAAHRESASETEAIVASGRR